MIDYVITLGIICIATAYITQYLLLVRMKSHFGPLASSTKVLIFPAKFFKKDGIEFVESAAWNQPVRPIDYLRRLTKSFDIDGNEWVVTSRADVWTCPFCLSMWTAFGGTAFLAYMYGIDLRLIFAHFCIAWVSQKLVNFDSQEGLS